MLDTYLDQCLNQANPENRKKYMSTVATPEINLAIVSSAFNEEANILSLYEACVEAAEGLQREMPLTLLNWRLFLIDNCSEDQTTLEIRRLIRRDQRVVAFRNARNYGVESSFMYGLQNVEAADVVMLMCADLQDPPSIGFRMLKQWIDNRDSVDAVLGSKERSAGTPIIKLGRKLYYRMMNFSNRDQAVLGGFHGFGCYSSSVIDQALWLWSNTSLNLRSCLISASSCHQVMRYVQPDRVAGRSSYSFLGYVNEALVAIFSGSSIAGRISLRIGAFGILVSIVLAFSILANKLSGFSGYAPGTVTVAILVIFSAAIQMIMLSLVSRQIEAQSRVSYRQRVQSRRISN
ncbi:glycosyltransferase [Synechococcus sp. BA-120 BA3]|nr:glycosyltransferase [Synechococcus sp. BA-120 BA3]